VRIADENHLRREDLAARLWDTVSRAAAVDGYGFRSGRLAIPTLFRETTVRPGGTAHDHPLKDEIPLHLMTRRSERRETDGPVRNGERLERADDD
jgi:hypothetical protein